MTEPEPATEVRDVCMECRRPWPAHDDDCTRPGYITQTRRVSEWKDIR